MQEKSSAPALGCVERGTRIRACVGTFSRHRDRELTDTTWLRMMVRSSCTEYMFNDDDDEDDAEDDDEDEDDGDNKVQFQCTTPNQIRIDHHHPHHHHHVQRNMTRYMCMCMHGISSHLISSHRGHLPRRSPISTSRRPVHRCRYCILYVCTMHLRIYICICITICIL